MVEPYLPSHVPEPSPSSPSSSSSFSSVVLWMSLVMIQLTSWCTLAAGREIRLGLLSPFQDTLHGWDTNAAGATMAVEKATRDGLLPGVDVQFHWEDDECSALGGAGKTVLLRYNYSVDAFIGPPCSASTTSAGLLAAYWNMPMFSQSSLDPMLAEKTEYSTLIRLKPSFNAMGTALVHIFDYFGWDRVVMVTARRTRDKNVFCDYSTHASAESFIEWNMTIADRIIIDDDPSDEEVDEMLFRLRQRGRIVALCTENPVAKRKILVRAHKADMHGGNYVFIMTDLSSLVTLDTSWFVRDPDDEEDQRGYVHVFQITVEQLQGKEVEQFRDDVPRKMAEPPWNYNGTIVDGKRGSESSPYLHDAVYLYLLLLNESLETGLDYTDGKMMFQRATKKTFIGLTGNVTLDKNGDRLPDYWLWTTSPDGDNFNVSIIAKMANEPSKIVHVVRAIQWNSQDGKLPRDSPVCGFDGELCHADPTATDYTLVFSVSGAVVIVAIMIAIWVYFYRRRLLQEKGLELMLWKIAYKDICFIKKSRTNSVCQAGTGSLLSGGTASFPTPASTGSSSTVGAEGSSGSSMVGVYKGQTVAIKKVNLTGVSFGRAEQLHLNKLKELNHENVLSFIGLCVDERFPCILTAYCAKGTLQNIIENEDIQLDWMFKFSLTSDLVNGMTYLHSSPVHYHGRLSSTTCHVDNRWTLKVADFGFHSCLSGLWQQESDAQQAKDLLWSAPEVLRKKTETTLSMADIDWQKADVFSFSIVLFELLYRCHPYDTYVISTEEIIQRIKSGESPPFRPTISSSTTTVKGPSDIPDIVLILMQRCWAESPHDRPAFHAIKTTVATFHKGRKTGIVDNMLKMLEKYANNLEDIVDQRTKELVEERKKSDMLLYRMLPRVVAEKLKAGNNVPPELYDSVTVYFSDIVDFTVLASGSSPMEIVDLLNDLYTNFDAIVCLHDVYKMETIGDAYMVVSGVPERNENRHVSEIANLALDLLSSISSFRIKHRPGMKLSLRIGLHTGPCAAGVVGRTMPRYCLFGDTVNMASRMESSGLPLSIQVSQAMKENLDKLGGYILTYRGTIEVKGKGQQSTYWLEGREGFIKPLPRDGPPSEYKG